MTWLLSPCSMQARSLEEPHQLLSRNVVGDLQRGAGLVVVDRPRPLEMALPQPGRGHLGQPLCRVALEALDTQRDLGVPEGLEDRLVVTHQDVVGLDRVAVGVVLPVGLRVLDQLHLGGRIRHPAPEGAAHHGVHAPLVAEAHALGVRRADEERERRSAASDRHRCTGQLEHPVDPRAVRVQPVAVHQLAQCRQRVRLDTCVARSPRWWKTSDAYSIPKLFLAHSPGSWRSRSLTSSRRPAPVPPVSDDTTMATGSMGVSACTPKAL